MLIVEKNRDLDADKFAYFFFESDRLPLMNAILEHYPSLRGMREKKYIQDFVVTLYKAYRETIDTVVGEVREIIEDLDPEMWRTMEEILNEKFDPEYHVYPTMLPMSPYGKDHFNISIMPNVLKNAAVRREVIAHVCVHELSHLLYLKKLERMLGCTRENLHKAIGVNHRSLDGLKEIYAPIIQNNPRMRKFFPNRVVGNQEFSLIKVEYKGHVMAIEDYFIERYYDFEKEDLERDEIDRKMLELLKDIDAQFSDKLRIYNNTNRTHLIRLGFFNPILIEQ